MADETATTDTPLDDVSAQLFLGMAARETLISRDVVGPFNRDAALIVKTIEERCGLAPGAIGTTHQLAADPPRVIPKPEAPPVGREPVP